MHGHVRKRVKMHRKPTGGTNKHGKHNIKWSRKGKGTHRATQHPEMPPKWLSPRRETSMAKPRTREANTEHKAQKQASIDMQIGVIQTLLYGTWCMDDDKDHRV